MTTAGAVLDALGDATRRAVLDELRSGALPVGVLAERLPVSRPAVSQHLRVLQDAGLVRATAAGTRRLYALDPEGARTLRHYLDDVWGQALDAFAALAQEESARQEEP
ncbi:metalloregulator ArsR/SmtB family transcription factor [Kineococcus sp. NPDC059986]|uniref:ArsR/SmtB family transcription factor n=1 Tax=Kineococcus sp. NPDC059986 TaxID=3155538 RepID=UPI0034506DAA